MRRSVVYDHMDAPGASPPSLHLSHPPEKMLMIVRIQTATPHRSVIHVESDKKIDRTTSLIFKFTPLNAPWLHPLLRRPALECLYIRLLIHADDDFLVCIEPVYILITPEDFTGQRDETLIDFSRLPVSAPMRLKLSLRQDARHRGVMDRSDDLLFDNHLLQTTAVPTIALQSVRPRAVQAIHSILTRCRGGKNRGTPAAGAIEDGFCAVLQVTLP